MGGRLIFCMLSLCKTLGWLNILKILTNFSTDLSVGVVTWNYKNGTTQSSKLFMWKLKNNVTFVAFECFYLINVPVKFPGMLLQLLSMFCVSK